MIHEMKLHPQPFAMIASSEKTIELRLNDEKRQQIQVGDTILFTSREDESKQIRATVLKLHRFSSFEELYAELPLEQCGYRPDELAQASPKDMEAYYTPEQQKRYGVLGIEIQLI